MYTKYYKLNNKKILVYGSKDADRICQTLTINGARIYKENIFKIIISFPKTLIECLLLIKKINSNKENIKNFLNLSLSVFYLKLLNPDIVLSGLFLDINYNKLAKIINSTRFISIQIGSGNGKISFSNEARYKYWLDQGISEFWLLGKFFIQYFKDEGLNSKKISVLGSLSNSLYIHKNYFKDPAYKVEKKHDLCIISNIKVGYPNYTSNQKFYQSLYKAIIKLNLKVVFAGRYSQKNDPDGYLIERNYFNTYLGEKINFIEFDEFSTYKASDESLVTLGDYTTALLESFARGNKIIVVNTSKYRELNFFIDGVWNLNEYDSQSIINKLNLILNYDEEEWANMTDKHKENFIKNPNTSESIFSIKDLLFN